MSKMLENIQMAMTGDRRLPPNLHWDIKATRNLYSLPHHDGIQHGYTLGVHYSTMGYCDPKDFERVERNFYEALKREIYGDLVSGLLAIERSLYQREIDTALNKVREILQKVS